VRCAGMVHMRTHTQIHTHTRLFWHLPGRVRVQAHALRKRARVYACVHERVCGAFLLFPFRFFTRCLYVVAHGRTGMPYIDVIVEAEDSVKLHCWFIRQPEPTKV
jgi:hypothetical protein